MPTTISNPATFSSVRNAFNTEAYGTSTSFFAYRQGGGIVPATSTFNVIGAGTAGDPLQLSQFNGFTVPSLSDTQSVTVGYHNFVDTQGGYEETVIGYSPTYLIGSISDGTFNLLNGATIAELCWKNIGAWWVSFQLSGNYSNAGWTSLTIDGTYTYNRSAATYINSGGITYWEWYNVFTSPFGTTPGVVKQCVFS